MAEEWSMDKVAEQFRLEIRERFEAINFKYRGDRNQEIAEFTLEHPKEAAEWHADPDMTHMMQIDNSPEWQMYQNTNIEIVNNSVTIILPDQFGISSDNIGIFEGTSVAWSLVRAFPVLVNGEPRISLDLILVDYWDDDKAAEWLGLESQASDDLERITT